MMPETRRAAWQLHLQALGDIVRDGLDPYTEPATAGFAEFLELIDDVHRKLRRHGKADTDRHAGLRKDRRIDADDLTLHVEERTARIAAVDRRVGLDETVVGSGIDIATACGDDTHGHGYAKAERIADDHHPIADPDLSRVAEGDGLERLLRFDLQEGEVGFRIHADKLRLQFRSIGEVDLDIVGILNDVVVGDYVAGRIDDEARTERVDRARPAALAALSPEKLVEELLMRRSFRHLRHRRIVVVALDVLRNRYVDDGVEQSLGEIGDGRRAGRRPGRGRLGQRRIGEYECRRGRQHQAAEEFGSFRQVARLLSFPLRNAGPRPSGKDDA